MADSKPDKAENPSPTNFWRLFLIVAVVLVIVGIIVLILGQLVVGGIIAVLGAVFGLGAKVVGEFPVE